MPVSSPEALKLIHDGTLALSRVEENGIRIDVPHLERTIDWATKSIKSREQKLRQSKEWKVWKRRFGDKAGLGKRKQLAVVVYDELGHKCKERTKPTKQFPKGQPKVDQAALEALGLPFITEWIKNEQLKKTLSTNLRGIQSELDGDGILHPFFGLYDVTTYRSNSRHPNFQNFPNRNKWLAKIVRTCFIPRPGRRIIEIDYSGIEVSVAACYHHDPRLIDDHLNGDMHRDMAAECFDIPKKEVTSAIRHFGKNMFVFPQFYGDWYRSNAKAMWEAAHRDKPKMTSGKCLSEHLYERFGKLGAGGHGKDSDPDGFEAHVKKVEHIFWKVRYKVYDQWKEDWWNNYLEQGGFRTNTGLYIEGVMSRNECINYPVQGSAFHCLLWSLMALQREIDKRGLKTLIIGQIHDSVVLDVPEEERKLILKLAHKTMIKKLHKAWKWLTVPMEVEAEQTPIDGSWFEKEKVA